MVKKEGCLQTLCTHSAGILKIIQQTWDKASQVMCPCWAVYSVCNNGGERRMLTNIVCAFRRNSEDHLGHKFVTCSVHREVPENFKSSNKPLCPTIVLPQVCFCVIENQKRCYDVFGVHHICLQFLHER